MESFHYSEATLTEHHDDVMRQQFLDNSRKQQNKNCMKLKSQHNLALRDVQTGGEEGAFIVMTTLENLPQIAIKRNEIIIIQNDDKFA